MPKLGAILYKIYVAVFHIFIWTPILVIFLLSFNDSNLVTLPFLGFTLKWYGKALHNSMFLSSLAVSIIVCIGVTSISVLVGLMTAMAFVRHNFFGKNVVQVSQFIPVVLPGIVFGISLLVLAYKFGVRTGYILTILGLSTWNITYATLIISGRLEEFDYSVEEAAMDLGANRLRALWRVTLPFLMPAVIVAWFYTFINSFNNFNVTIFLIGDKVTFPIYMYSQLRKGLTPEITAISSLLSIPLFVIAIINSIIQKRTNVISE
jgi:spermidine/putrescine transport system permease protein